MGGADLLDRIKIGVKLPLLTVMIGAIALMLAEFIASRNTTATVAYSGQERLRAVAESRAAEILRDLQSIRADMRAKYRNPVILDAARAFVFAWNSQPGNQLDHFRTYYIDENPNPAERRYALTHADDGSPYSLVHRRYHPFFTAHVTGQGYSDLFLISPDGDVVYSTAKQEPFGRNLNDEGLRGLPLSQAYRTVIGGTGFSTDILTHFARSPAYPDADTAVFAVPVRSPLGTIDAVLAVRVSAERFTHVMQRSAGLGRTGEGFMLARDGHLVTDLRGARPAALKSGAGDAPPVTEVFRSRSGVTVHADSSGQRIVTAFVPLLYMGHQFGVMVQQAEAEILTPARVQRTHLIEEGMVVLAFVTLIGLLLARSMSVPLARVGDAMQRVANREYDSDIPDRRRGDEIGEIARRLDTFRASLFEAETISRENAFKRAAFESTSAALMLVDRDLTIIYVNEQQVALMERHQTAFDRLARNFSPGSLTGRSLYALFPGAERARSALASERHVVEKLRLGETYLTVDMGPVNDAEGRVLGYVVEWRDVSAEHTERAVLQAVNRSLQLAEFSPDGRLVSANRQLALSFGQSQTSLVGLDWDRFLRRLGVPHDSVSTLGWDRLATQAASEGTEGRIAIRGADSLAHAGLFPVWDEDGRLHRFVFLGVGRLAEANRALRPLTGVEQSTGEQRA